MEGRAGDVHPWLTSENDLPFAALMAVTGNNASAIYAEAEEIYAYLDGKLKANRDTRQMLSRVLDVRGGRSQGQDPPGQEALVGTRRPPDKKNPKRPQSKLDPVFKIQRLYKRGTERNRISIEASLAEAEHRISAESSPGRKPIPAPGCFFLFVLSEMIFFGRDCRQLAFSDV